MLRRPGAQEFGQFRVAALGQNHFQRDILVAARAVGPGRALALETQNAAGVGMGRHGHGDVARRGRHGDFPAERRLGQGHRQLEMDVVALAPEKRMGRDVDFDERVAARAAADARAALPLEAQDMPVAHACGNGDVEALVCARVSRRLAPLTASRKSTVRT